MSIIVIVIMERIPVAKDRIREEASISLPTYMYIYIDADIKVDTDIVIDIDKTVT